MSGTRTGISFSSSGVTTMKMMSKTRTTSTRGVTLMFGWVPLPVLMAMTTCPPASMRRAKRPARTIYELR